MRIEFQTGSAIDPKTGGRVDGIVAVHMGVEVGRVVKNGRGRWTAHVGDVSAPQDHENSPFPRLSDAKTWIVERTIARQEALDREDGYTVVHVLDIRNGTRASVLGRALRIAMELDPDGVFQLSSQHDEQRRCIGWRWFSVEFNEMIGLRDMGEDGVRRRYHALRDAGLAKRLASQFPGDISLGDAIRVRHVDGIDEPAPRPPSP